MKIGIALLSVLVSGISFSQQKDSLSEVKYPRYIVKMTHGLTEMLSFDFTTAQWEKMTPGYQIPDSLKPSDYGGIFNDGVNSFSSASYYMFSFSFINGKEKRAGRKFLSTTSIHLGYGPEFSARKNWYHENKQVIDTLTSNQSGEEFYVTGNRNQTISKSYHSQTLVLGVGQHIATNPARIFQFETGVDVLCLLSVASQVRVSYVDSYTVEGLPQTYQGGYPVPSPEPTTSESTLESFRSKFTMGLIMRVPLEMSFKLSKKNPVVSRMRLGAELNPGLATVFTGGLISSSFNISGGMNFRFAF